MLEVSDATTLNETAWKLLASHTQLARSVAELLVAPAHGPPRPISRRRFQRQRLRNIAILLAGDQRHAAFTKDLSRAGIAFYAPVHLFPKRVVDLWLPPGRILRLRITRCLRRGVDCFECGSVFHSHDECE
jgi:hypothetical protein